MKRRLAASELIFKIISYLFLGIFALMCLYPFVFTLSSAISSSDAVDSNQIILIPKDIQFDAFKAMFTDNQFWNSYANTLFLTVYGTIWSVGVSILGG